MLPLGLLCLLLLIGLLGARPRFGELRVPLAVDLGGLGDDLGLRRGEVVLLANVGHEIEQLRRLIASFQQLVLALANRPLGTESPKELGVRSVLGLAGDVRQQIDAVDRRSAELRAAAAATVAGMSSVMTG